MTVIVMANVKDIRRTLPRNCGGDGHTEKQDVPNLEESLALNFGNTCPKRFELALRRRANQSVRPRIALPAPHA